MRRSDSTEWTTAAGELRVSDARIYASLLAGPEDQPAEEYSTGHESRYENEDALGYERHCHVPPKRITSRHNLSITGRQRNQPIRKGPGDDRPPLMSPTFFGALMNALARDVTDQRQYQNYGHG